MEELMKILIVDDEADIRASLTEILEEEGYAVYPAATAAAGRNVMEQGVDMALVDIKLGEDNGIDLLRDFKKVDPDFPVVMISGHGTIKLAARAFKLGAYDFMEKPLRLVQVRTCVRNVMERVRLKKRLTSQGMGTHQPVFKSGIMTELFAHARKLAGIREPVLVSGPSGSGKELVARTLHYAGTRAAGAFIATNAASMPVNLAEDELFGHVKGAFTGADRDRKGCLEQADKGTLFLDEIADMPPDIQAKMLRVLENGTFSRLGETVERSVDVRIVCATHKNMELLIRDGIFREDLWYRINAFTLSVPPLSARQDDIPVLAETFLAATCTDMGITKTFTEGALNALARLPFPGNVRELKHTIARLAVYSEGEAIDTNDVTSITARTGGSAGTGCMEKYAALSFKDAREAFEKDFLQEQLKRADGNITATAGAIGMAQSNLSRKLKELGLR